MEKKILYIFVGTVIILMCFVAGLFLYTSSQKGKQETAYSIHLYNNAVHFEGMVDDVVDFSKIESIAYKEINFEGKKIGVGEATSIFLVGDAKTEEFGKCRAYVYYDKPYYIVMKTEDSTFVFNLPKEQECKKLYNKLLERIQL